MSVKVLNDFWVRFQAPNIVARKAASLAECLATNSVLLASKDGTSGVWFVGHDLVAALGRMARLYPGEFTERNFKLAVLRPMGNSGFHFDVFADGGAPFAVTRCTEVGNALEINDFDFYTVPNRCSAGHGRWGALCPNIGTPEAKALSTSFHPRFSSTNWRLYSGNQFYRDIATGTMTVDLPLGVTWDKFIDDYCATIKHYSSKPEVKSYVDKKLAPLRAHLKTLSPGPVLILPFVIHDGAAWRRTAGAIHPIGLDYNGTMDLRADMQFVPPMGSLVYDPTGVVFSSPYGVTNEGQGGIRPPPGSLAAHVGRFEMESNYRDTTHMLGFQIFDAIEGSPIVRFTGGFLGAYVPDSGVLPPGVAQGVTRADIIASRKASRSAGVGGSLPARLANETDEAYYARVELIMGQTAAPPSAAPLGLDCLHGFDAHTALVWISQAVAGDRHTDAKLRSMLLRYADVAETATHRAHPRGSVESFRFTPPQWYHDGLTAGRTIAGII